MIFEGGGNTEFDVRVTSTLFPAERERLNFLSAGGRSQGAAMHEAVKVADAASDIKRKIFSVTDKDSDADTSVDNVYRFSWDRYHIENYLLDFACIATVSGRILAKNITDKDVERDLKALAEETMGPLVRHELMKFVRRSFGDLLSVKVDPHLADLATPIHKHVTEIEVKLRDVTDSTITLDHLRTLEADARKRYTKDLASGDWIKSFKGRDILKQYCEKRLIVVQYDALVNLVLDEMVLNGVKPSGMSDVMTKIDQA